MRVRHGLGLALGLSALSLAAQPMAVPVPSLDAPAGQAVVLNGQWFSAAAVATAAPAPAMVLMHGCGGQFDRDGHLAERYTGLAARLNRMGVHVLVLDSFTSRGVKEICTQVVGKRPINQQQRRRDALGALRWLSEQPQVDKTRLGLLGWSNGGSTVLAALNLRQAEVAAAGLRPSLAVAYYPGCEAELQRGFEPSAPLLLLLGESDDWTPAGPCKALAHQAKSGPLVEWEAYEGAFHGFDGTAPVRLRRDVPGGVKPGAGVTVGANPAAREGSAARLTRFLNFHWKLQP